MKTPPDPVTDDGVGRNGVRKSFRGWVCWRWILYTRKNTSRPPQRPSRNEQLARIAELHSFTENSCATAFDLAENCQVAGEHQLKDPPSGRRQIAAGCRAGFKEALRAGGLELQKLAPTCFMSAAHDIRRCQPESRQLVRRQIDPAPLGILANVTQDIRQLKRQAAVNRPPGSPGIPASPDGQAGQTDNRGHAVAVNAEVVESGIGGLVQVQLHAVEHFQQV